ncbi:MAG: hydroxymethylpyrimidine/phosphomethylpyrimidine kinase [Deltaproteobacteria bacterium]|nr:hydroxymethylpyrimidine/phosphomethylpyrimidine kinase [Deltaproteobacteria bacterium]
MKKILLIAGLDPSGNAGLLRDLEMVHTFSLQVASVVTALTAQNARKFLALQPVSPRAFELQLRSIAPLSQYNAVKIGMLGNERLVQILIRFLKREKKRPPIVLDPVLRSTTGGSLLNFNGQSLLWKKLVPLVSLWTPNTEEASFFSGLKIRSAKEMEEAAEILRRAKKTPVLIKGGHLKGERVQDLYFNGREKTWFVFGRHHVGVHGRAPLRGTGCALSTLIACFLAGGFPVSEAVRQGRVVMQRWIENQDSF